MRKLFSFLTVMLATISAFSQPPAQLNYQGVARKHNGHPIDNDAITLRLTIRDGSAVGPVVYQEQRATMTNAFGLFNIAIGGPGATLVVGSIATVDWSTGSKYLQVEMDPDGGTTFLNMGTQQLLSVPYALNAGGAPPIGPAGGDLTGTYPNPTVARLRGVNVNPLAPTLNQVLGYNGTDWTPTSLSTHPDNYWRLTGSDIYNANSGNVGIGINTPSYKLDVNGTLRTTGFIMPTGAGDGKFLRSDASGAGTWSSSIAATSIVLPYKDSAASTTDHIFHIIQTSPFSFTGALFGETRSTLFGSMAVGGSATNGYGLYGRSNNSSGVFGYSASGAGYRAGVFGYADQPGGNGTFGYATQTYGFGALGISEKSTGVYGQTNSPTFSAYVNDGAAVYALATQGGTGVFSNSFSGIAGRFESMNPLNSNNTLEVFNSGTGRASLFEINNASNSSTAMLVTTNGLGRAIAGRSQMPGFVNGGVIDALSTTVGGNAIFGRGTRPFGWGVYGLSDSAAGVAGLGIHPGSVGVYGQGYRSLAGQFVIDNSFVNASNVVEISTTQGGNGVVVNLNNAARGVQVDQNGNGIGVFANSNLGAAGRFENTNASNFATTLEVVSNGNNRAIFAQSDLVGPVNAGVIHAQTTIFGSNAFYARATKPQAWGLASISDSSVAVGGIGYRPGSVGIRGQGWSGMAGQFVIDNSLLNTSNVVEISNTQSGSGLVVNVANGARGVHVDQNGNGIGILSNSNLGNSGRFENTNAGNSATTLDVISNGTGRAIYAQSDLPGPVFGGVIHSHTGVFGSNAVYARATRPQGWGVAAISDSSVAVGGVGFRPGSIGIFGQGYSGVAGRFLIDNSFVNSSNTVEVVNTQSGNGITVDLNNTARGIDVMQAGSGIGIYSNSNTGYAARFENTNVLNTLPVQLSTTTGQGMVIGSMINNGASSADGIHSLTNGFGRAVYGQSAKGHGLYGHSVNAGYGSAGVFGLNTSVGGNGLYGYANQVDDWGILAHSEISIGVYGQSNTGNAAYFYTSGAASAVPTVYTLNHGLSNTGFFTSLNPNNVADAVSINRTGAGRSLFVGGSHHLNSMNFYAPHTTGKPVALVQGPSGLGLLAHANGTFYHAGTGERVGVGAYGMADSAGSNFNYGFVATASGATRENAGVIGWISSTAAGTDINAAIYGHVFAGGAATKYAGYFVGNVHATGILSKGGGAFKIDHPQDPENKFLVHSFVESPDMMNIYNGNATTDASGKAVVELPTYFQAENIDFKYQLTVIGQFAQAIIAEEVNDNKFVIMTDKPNVKVSWQVTGVRNDKFAQQNRIVPEVDKKPHEQGKYLNPELYGKPQTQGIGYMTGGMPKYVESTTIAEKQQTNEAQNLLNAGVERKSKLVVEGSKSNAVVENFSTEKPRVPTQNVADEKLKMMSASEEKFQSPTTTPKAPAEIVTDEKSKQLLSTVTAVEPVTNEKKQPKENENAGQSSKAKKLSSDTEVKTEKPAEKKVAVKASDEKKLSKPEIALPKQ